MGAFANDVSTLSSLGGVVRTVGATVMHFHSGWSGPTECFGHEGYYAGDGRYRYVGHQQDRRALGQENRTIWNVKPDHSVSPKSVAISGRQRKQGVPKDGASANRSRGSKEQTGPRSNASANDDEAKLNAERGPGEVAAEPDRVPEEKTEAKTEAGTSLQWPPNRTVRFPKPDQLVSSGSGQRKASRTTASGMAPTPHWCPLGLTPNQRRKI
jgi:hypothetical protein